MSFDPSKLSPFYTYKTTFLNPGAGGSQQLMLYNPYRVAFLLSVGGLSYINLDPNVSSSRGLGVPNPGFQTFSLATHGPFVQQAMWIAYTAAEAICLIEVLWVPPGT